MGGPIEEVSGAEQKAPEPSNFLDRLITSLFRSDDPEREKRRQLRQIAKQLSKAKQKHYKTKGEQVQPSLARFFFDIYKVVGPAQNLLQNAQESQALKQITVDAFLTDSQREARDFFAEEQIRRIADGMDPKALASLIKEKMVALFGSFDAKLVKSINTTYNAVQILLRFVAFDYYFLVKKFDSSVPEHDYSYKPKFEAINGEYVSDDIKDFLEVAIPLERDLPWDKVLDILQAYKGVEVIARPAWKKILAAMEDLRRSGTFVMMVQHIDKNPQYVPTPRVARDRIVEGYLNNLKGATEVTVQKIMSERRKGRIDQLAIQVFGTPAVSRTKNYTDKANGMFSKRMVAGFVHTEALNYLKAFLLDYFKKDIREVVQDQLLVRGKWTANMTAKRFSDAYHQTLQVSDQVVQFDDSLGEEGELGVRLRKAMGRVVDRDANSNRLLKQLVDQINQQAKTMVNQAAQNLIIIAKQVKELLEDLEKENHQLVMNWKELEAGSEAHLKDRLLDMYKKIFYFVQLLQIFVKR